MIAELTDLEPSARRASLALCTNSVENSHSPSERSFADLRDALAHRGAAGRPPATLGSCLCGSFSITLRTLAFSQFKGKAAEGTRGVDHSTIAMVRPSSRADMAKVAVSARSPKRRPMGAPQRTPEQAILNIGVCNNCLVDSIMARFSRVFCERMYTFGIEMNEAAKEIVALRLSSRIRKLDPAELTARNSRSAKSTGLHEDTPLYDRTIRGMPKL